MALRVTRVSCFLNAFLFIFCLSKCVHLIILKIKLFVLFKLIRKVLKYFLILHVTVWFYFSLVE